MDNTGTGSIANLVAELGQLEAHGRALAVEEANKLLSGEAPASNTMLDSAVSSFATTPETPPDGEQPSELAAATDIEKEGGSQSPHAAQAEEALSPSGDGKRRRATTPRKTPTRRARTTKKKATASEENAPLSEQKASQELGDTVLAIAVEPPSGDGSSLTAPEIREQTTGFAPDRQASDIVAQSYAREEEQEPFTSEVFHELTSSSAGEDQAQREMLTRLRGFFAIEAEEHLQVITDALLALEHDQSHRPEDEVLETLFRRVHTLKGAARAVNLREIEAISQVVESVCAALKRKEIGGWPEFFDTLHRMTDLVRQLSKDPEGPSQAKVSEMLAEVSQLETQGRERVLKHQQIDDAPLENREEHLSLAPSAEFQAVLGEKRQEALAYPAVTQSADVEPQHTPDFRVQLKEPRPTTRLTVTEKMSAQAISSIPPKRSAPPQEKGRGPKKAASTTETVRIKASKLDSLFLQAEEMLAVKLKTSLHAAELRGLSTMLEAWRREWAKVHTDIRKTQRLLEKEENRLTQDPIYVQSAKLVDFLDWTHDHLKALEKTLLQVTRAVTQDQQSLGGMVDILLEDAKKVLMLPFASALEVLPKMVRDLSRAQGKEVDFVLQGGEVEIDKRILEEMKDPLIHILRNCIDHGIESPTEREQQQKPPRGTISIAIAPGDGNTVEIIVTDDGAGIAAAKVRDAAVKCGLLSRKAVDQLSDQEAIALIFQSEVSTSSTVSDISGRGLGMAIVREKVEKLGGQIAVETQLHQGSTFRIRLPLTLATFRGIQVQTAGQAFVVPTANVERVVRVNRNDIHTVGNKETISLAGYTLPLIRLDQALGLAAKAKHNDGGRFQLALVVGQDERQIAFGVDVVVNEQEVLFKSLGKQLVRVRNIAGATVLGSGQVVPVLNVSDLLASAGGNSLALAAPIIEAPQEESSKRSILVAEDSITSRMLLKEILESAGYAVSTAIDGEDAFSTLQKANFDLIVSDVEMPRMNGFALTSKIRGDDRYTQLPVVLVTGLESQADRERGIDAGANAYVVKGSFDQSNLLETIRRLI
jgi:two-component system, chemotaxis family, sensor kinase CheA